MIKLETSSSIVPYLHAMYSAYWLSQSLFYISYLIYSHLLISQIHHFLKLLFIYLNWAIHLTSKFGIYKEKMHGFQ